LLLLMAGIALLALGRRGQVRAEKQAAGSKP
jgi:hypothetical protein